MAAQGRVFASEILSVRESPDTSNEIPHDFHDGSRQWVSDGLPLQIAVDLTAHLIEASPESSLAVVHRRLASPRCVHNSIPCRPGKAVRLHSLLSLGRSISSPLQSRIFSIRGLGGPLPASAMGQGVHDFQIGNDFIYVEVSVGQFGPCSPHAVGGY